MKIVANTPSELIIRDSAMPLRALGAFLVAIGAFAVSIGVTQGRGGKIGVVPTVIGSVLVLAGGALIVLPARSTYAFSRSERVFIIARQRFGRVRRESIPLADIKDAVVEASASTDGGNTYRVAITLRDERRIPWTSYYTSGYASKYHTVEQIRAFLGQPAAPGSSRIPTFADEKAMRRGRLGLMLMGAFCCLFLGVGVVLLAKEQRRLSTYEPVSATVLSARVEEHSDSDGSTYEPVVVYRYRVDGREYTARRVTPLAESRSGDWARNVAARYRAGDETTAYYDPERPAESFLLRSRSFIPWAFVTIPGVAILIIGAALRNSGEWRATGPRRVSPGRGIADAR